MPMSPGNGRAKFRLRLASDAPHDQRSRSAKRPDRSIAGGPRGLHDKQRFISGSQHEGDHPAAEPEYAVRFPVRVRS